MITPATGLVAVFLYALGTLYQSMTLSAQRTGQNNQRSRVIFLGLFALLAHLINVYTSIVTDTGYNFGFYKVATLFCWTIVALVLLSSIKRPIENLLLLLFPLAIIGILASLLLESPYTSQNQYSTGMAVHILLAIVATSVITIAAFQAVFISFQNRQLKDKHSVKFISHLPPLQTMEGLLFEIVWVGLILLSGVILTGIIFMDDLFEQHLSHKLFFSVIAWAVFAVLLWGRHKLGWRGRTAIRWTLTGFVFLVLAYFGSKLVLELILNRV